MKHYGTKVSNGLGLGKCVIINDVVPEVNDSKIDSTSIDNEILKVNNSIDECIKSYENIINSLVDDDLKQLCDFNKMVLKAKSLKIDIENNIRENLINGAYAITSYFNKKADDLSKSDNNYLKERSTDIIDIKNKVLKSFMGIKSFDLSEIKEFTVEAGRPDTINREMLEVLKRNNVDRISINPQSMNDETLKKIGRNHNVQDIIDCFHLAREIGFDNINMDIILGLVDENLDMVRNTLDKIKELSPESLTVHTLAVKRTSKLKENLQDYELAQYEEMVKMISLAKEYAKDMGLNPYYMYRQKHMLGNLENIGYAKEGYECIYNMQIMEEKQSNYALGAGSITKFVYPDEDRIERVENVKNVEQYINRVDEMIKRKYEEVEKNAK